LTTCQKCPSLVKSRTKIVKGRGPAHADLLFLGEAPGREEDEQEKAFVGKAGRVLATLVKQAGLKPSEIYLLNACFCRPPGNRTPRPEELANCRPNVIEIIKRVQPKVIVTLGVPALATLYRRMVLGDVAGQTLVQEDTGIPLVPTYHPAFVMRRWAATPMVVAHMQKAARLAKSGVGSQNMGDYAPILSLPDLRALRTYLVGPEVKSFAFDTETTGLDWMRDELICITFSPNEGGVGYIVPILRQGWEPFWNDNEWAEVICLLREIFASDKPKQGQNAHFDVRFLERRQDEEIITAATAFGLRVENLDQDTLFLSRALQENVSHHLTDLTAFWTDLPYYEEEVMQLSQRKRRMIDVPDIITWKYGAADADVVARIAPQLQEKVNEQGSGWLLDNITTPLVRACWEMERRGVLVDTKLFKKLCTHYTGVAKKYEKQLQEVAGKKVSMAPAGLQQYLFKDLGFPIPNERTDGAKGCGVCTKEHPCIDHVTTDKAVLEALYAEHKHPAIPIILDLKGATKFYSTYLGGDTGGYGRYICSDNRIHAHVKVSFADTGRHSYEKPNLQNPPKDIHIPELGLKDAFRQLFIAPPGCVLMNADWSQLEVWVLGYQTGDPTLMGLLLGGEDVHTYVARKLGELEISDLFPNVGVGMDDQDWRQEFGELRGKAKVFTFGINYGLTDEGAASRLGCGMNESHALMGAYVTDIFPTLPAYFKEIERGMLTDYRIKNKFGRWRHFPEIPILQILGYKYDLQKLIRKGYNFPIQSGGHDLHGRAHVVTEGAEELKGRANIILEVHDSLVFEAKAPSPEYTLETAWLIKNLWERVAKETILPDGTKLGWQCPVEVSWGRSLGEQTTVLTANGNVVTLDKEV